MGILLDDQITVTHAQNCDAETTPYLDICF